MRILIANDSPFAHYFIRLGLSRAFVACGHEVIIWDINKKPTFDAFDEFDPQLFIGQTYNVDDAIIKCVAERPDMKVIMKASDWGNISDSLDRKRFPVLIANKKEIDNIKRLKDETGKPDFGYIHYMEHRLPETHNHWDSVGLRIESLLSAADVFDFVNGVSKPEYECDMGFLGGRWGYKSVTFDKWFMPLLNPQSDLKVKIFGNQSWGVPQYCGVLPNGEEKHFLKSCSVCPNLSEPHSQAFGYDLLERVWKLWANKCFCISDYVEDFEKIFPAMPMYRTPKDFMEGIDCWTKVVNNEQTKQDIIDECYDLVINSGTYFHRISHIFNKLDCKNESEDAIITYRDIKGKLKI